MLGATLFYASAKHGELAKCGCVLPGHTRLSVYTTRCPIILRKEACVMLGALLQQSNRLKCSPHRLRSAPPGGSWARGCAPPHTNTLPWHPYKDNKNRQCHGSFFFFNGIRVGLIRGICGRRCRVCTAPSNRNRLGRGGIFKKQRPGSDPETTWKQKCALDLIVRGQNKQLENRRVWQMM